MSRRSTKRMLTIVLAVPALLLMSTIGADRAGASHTSARASLAKPDGSFAGSVRLTATDGVIVVKAQVKGLAPGFHGFHVHAVGECVAPFTSAGGHFNPGETGHGQHAGDMPSLLVNENGTAFAAFATDRFELAELFDADGSAIIVHEGADNFANIPDRYLSTTENVNGPDSATLATGDAGARAACGVVRR